MITETEVAWLQTRYPNLTVNAARTEISGELVFAAAYDKATDTFTPLTQPGQTAPGIVLRGSYEISIKKGRNDKTLPTLQVLGNKITPILDRHFYDTGHACLCGPVEEINHMSAGISFPRYLEVLVYPFLYAQRHYDTHEEWPWKDYPHGSAGALESFYRAGSTQEHAEVCIRKIQLNVPGWPRMEKLLSGQEHVNGATNCVCGPRHKMREHPAVWYGLLKLRQAIAGYDLSIQKTAQQQDESVKK
ncbi:MAG TPA: hypothetical protein VGP13_03470 [Candidatus Paceibacterota bacterium]|jgi:hypothetical protein|nr:hypothetical protein [Candidatus Paceibacterota bacterium]